MTNYVESRPLGLATKKRSVYDQWGIYGQRKGYNVKQQTVIWKEAKKTKDLQTLRIAIGSSAALQYCNRRVIVAKKGDSYQHVGAWYCGKRYCSFCSNRKRRKIFDRFNTFFATQKGKDILDKYDLGMFTVTLQHNTTDLRTDPYYKELSTHWNHAMKYGKFRQYIAGGFYNTEHTHGRNGHHIHRHALVLIPKQYKLRENWRTIQSQLRQQWESRTGGSFQIDLTPVGMNKQTGYIVPEYVVRRDLSNYLQEVTKYITKRNKGGVIKWEIIKAVEENSRSKFYGKFGILYKIRELNFTDDKWQLLHEGKQIKTSNNKKYLQEYIIKKDLKDAEVTEIDPMIEPSDEIRELYIATPHVVRRKVKGDDKAHKISYSMKDMIPIPDSAEAFSMFKETIRDRVYEWKNEKWNKILTDMTVERWKSERSGNFEHYKN